jgi:class 3 adenylate cyclase
MSHWKVIIRSCSGLSLKVHVSLLLFFILFFTEHAHAQFQLPDTITSLWARYKNTGSDSAKVVYLSKLAFFYNDYLEEKIIADSLAEAAIMIAEKGLSVKMKIVAYNNYIQSTDHVTYYKKALGYGKKAFLNCQIINDLDLKWQTWMNLTRIYLSNYEFKNAFSAGNQALNLAKALKNDRMIAESELVVGKSFEINGKKIDAFRNYLAALNLAEKHKDPELKGKCYSHLSGFYRDAMMYDEAIDYKKKECTNILMQPQPDSMALMWARCDWQLIELQYMNSTLNEQYVKDLIDFAIRSKNYRMKDFSFALYRAHLLKSEEVPKLYNFYKNTYPVEFAKLYFTDKEMYYRLSAYFAEFENRPDSADFFFRKSEQLVVQAPGKRYLYQANFYNRYGQFLLRQGRSDLAIEKLKKSYSLGDSEVLFGRFEYMLTASTLLEKLYKQAGDYKNAWYYASANLRIKDSISIISKKDLLMSESVKRERSLKDAAAEQDRQKIRQGRNQLYMMGGGVVFFIIVSLLVYRNFRNQKRLNILLDAAKKKSDDLLLNILPQETAEELKATGRAKAKHFNEVTVLFTDFKNFTLASEQMSPEKLVELINFYFSEFDNIISRHNIEKIKIIGDSYMCAGGLPVVNKTHATDVVAAAVEFQEFVMKQKKERESRKEPFFELRIGIHTGPVVAGIVGHKKFAYDIWGDTVNTASRMESSGEINQVNISGATYEKVKDRFKCTYRGKVTAKNKGEIDMYFVDVPLAE